MKDYVNTYVDTRGLGTEPLPFTKAIVKGIAEGGGLLVPKVLPQLALDEIIALGTKPYAHQAAWLYRRFGVDMPAERIETLMELAYGASFDDERITPIVEVAPGTHVLELWHGPTSAFKDMALQCLPLFFSEALAANPDASDYLILVATSGDTGKAALEGFADRAHTNIVVFYPQGGVSDVQFLQMATQRGNNVGVFGVKGN
ncbi:MAG: threonine synthase, partial [Coriobacteriales bacterium]|nr:threonine synthase [Coriobacteriales bacterium]